MSDESKYTPGPEGTCPYCGADLSKPNSVTLHSIEVGYWSGHLNISNECVEVDGDFTTTDTEENLSTCCDSCGNELEQHHERRTP